MAKATLDVDGTVPLRPARGSGAPKLATDGAIAVHIKTNRFELRDLPVLNRALARQGITGGKVSLVATLDGEVKHPDAKVVAHPECEAPILDTADNIGSTNALLNYVVNDNAQKFIVVTESGILHEMKKRAPNKQLIAAPPEANCHCNECPFMRLNTPEKVYAALDTLSPRLEMDEALRAAAQLPLDRMLALG